MNFDNIYTMSECDRAYWILYYAPPPRHFQWVFTREVCESNLKSIANKGDRRKLLADKFNTLSPSRSHNFHAHEDVCLFMLIYVQNIYIYIIRTLKFPCTCTSEITNWNSRSQCLPWWCPKETTGNCRVCGCHHNYRIESRVKLAMLLLLLWFLTAI